MRVIRIRVIAVCCMAVIFAGVIVESSVATELSIGTAITDITPKLPIVRGGAMGTRVSRKVESSLTATALAMEGGNGEQAIMISCDIVCIRPPIQKRVRELAGPKLASLGFDVEKLVLNATHAHTTPALDIGRYLMPEGVVTTAEYVDFLVDKLADVALEAWKGRRPGCGVSWGMGHAVVGHSRLPTYQDGTTTMYGKTDRADFSHFEGFEDHAVNVLFFWDGDKKLLAMSVNLSAPAQTVENQLDISADYWHDARQVLRKQYSADLPILAWCGAAGETSPHLMYDEKAEARMRAKRGLSETQEIARRISRAVADAYEVAKDDIHFDVPFAHRVAQLQLPTRIISDERAATAQARVEEWLKKFDSIPPTKGEAGRLHRQIGREITVVDRHERQKNDPSHEVEIHVLRMGDVAIATNSFELFVDYGLRIKARSKALQTFVIQLASSADIYLPTKQALEGGGYGSIITVSVVGPEGGKKLVDSTVELINSLWSDQEKKK